MAEGNLRLPNQFHGLVRREPFDFENPFEICEVEPIVNKDDFVAPAQHAWLLAAESWPMLMARAQVWHYVNRENPVAHGCIAMAFQGVILSGEGPLLWYKPVSEHAHFEKHCVFRRVPAPLHLSFHTCRVPQGVKVNIYSFGGNDIAENTYDIRKTLTWYQLKIDIRVALMAGGRISAARSFQLRDASGAERPPQTFAFRPSQTNDLVLEDGVRQSDIDASTDSMCHTPDDQPTSQGFPTPSEKKPASAKAMQKKPASAKAMQKKPASVKGDKVMKRPAAAKA